MCLAIPARVIEIDGSKARVDMVGNAREADLSLVDDIRVGDYVLLHAGYAIQKIDAEDAQETLELIAKFGDHADDADGN